jgi:hypothetical protein
MNRRRLSLIAALLVCALIAAASACSLNPNPSSSKEAGENATKEQESIATGFGRLTDSQPVPSFDYSQERQIVIDTETIRAEGTHGTAVATTLDGSLLWWCPTTGAPVPSTYQLSSETQYVDIPGDRSHERFPLEQGEPTGVYVGDSAATWSICLDDNGNPFAKYEEANVGWTSGVVNGLPAEQRAQVDEITFAFTVPDK